MSDDVRSSSPQLDGKLLAKFLFSLNVVRHQSEIYPENHPLVIRSLERTVELLRNLLSAEERLTIGIARDKIVVGTQILDPRNAIYRDLAASLFACDIASVILPRSLPSHELWELLLALRMGRTALQEHGGIRNWLQARGNRFLNVRVIDYRSIQTVEESVVRGGEPRRGDSESIWLAFVEGIVSEGGDSDPERLARMLNERSKNPKSDEEEYERAIAAFLQKIDLDDVDGARHLPLRKLDAFFSELAPDVRQKFLSSTFRRLADRREVAQNVLAAFSEDLLIQTLHEIEEEKISVPPLVLELLVQLSGHGPDERRQVAAAETAEEHIRERVRTLFREDRSDLFVPPEYHRLLRALQAPAEPLAPDPLWTEKMVLTLESHALEKQLCSVLLQIREELPGEGSDELESNLSDLISFFLREGNLAALIATHDRLAASAQEGGPSAHLAREGLGFYSRPEFVGTVIEMVDRWDRRRLPEIQALIATVGSPFIDPLLERLATEKEMFRRRFHMETLLRLRYSAVPAICARLHDERWYFVRNLVIILRKLEDPSLLDPLVGLVSYPHPKVQSEVMRVFHQFCDPRGDLQLMTELSSSDPQRRTRAVQAARWGVTPDLFRFLCEMLADGFTAQEYPVKSALVQTLAEIGTPQTIDGLAQLMEKRSLFQRLVLRRLQTEAVAALGKHPSEAGRRLLDRIAASKTSEIAEMARQSLRKYPVRTP